MRKIVAIILLLLFIIPVASTANDGLGIGYPKRIDLVGKYLIYCNSNNFDYDIETVLRSHDFGRNFITPSTCKERITSFKEFYILINIDTISEISADYYLSIDPSATQAELWFIDNHDEIRREISGTFTPVSSRTFVSEVLKNIFPIHYNNNYPYCLLIIKSEIESVSPKLDMELIETNHYSGNLVFRKVWNGFLYGFIALISLHGFILFYFLKDLSYLLYGIFTALAILTITYINKDIADFIMFRFDDLSPKYIYFFKVFVYAFAVFYLLFIWYSTRSNITFEKWRKIVYWVILMAFPFLVFDLIIGYQRNFDPNITVLLLNNYMILVSVSTLIFAIQVIINKQRRYIFFALGIVFMAAGILATGVARINSWIFPSFFFKTGIVAEIILFSFGLGYNYYLMHKNEINHGFFGASSLSNTIFEDKLLFSFFSYLKKNLSKPDLSIDQICKSLSISKANLYRKLKQETNQTPIQIINQMKMEEGMNLLMTTRLNISEIAYELGYADPNYFTRRFTKYFGNPPSFYRYAK